jgi:hypothetical protein
MASFLEPKLSEVEIIEAIRFHYPLNIQRVMLNVQMKNISETLDLVKRIEIMENREFYDRGPSVNETPVLENRRYESNRSIESRNTGSNQVRRIQRQSNQGNNNDYRPQRRNCYESEEECETINTKSDFNNTQNEAREYNQERRTGSHKLYDRQCSGN